MTSWKIIITKKVILLQTLDLTDFTWIDLTEKDHMMALGEFVYYIQLFNSCLYGVQDCFDCERERQIVAFVGQWSSCFMEFSFVISGTYIDFLPNESLKKLIFSRFPN